MQKHFVEAVTNDSNCRKAPSLRSESRSLPYYEVERKFTALRVREIFTGSQWLWLYVVRPEAKNILEQRLTERLLPAANIFLADNYERIGLFKRPVNDEGGDCNSREWVCSQNSISIIMANRPCAIGSSEFSYKNIVGILRAFVPEPVSKMELPVQAKCRKYAPDLGFADFSRAIELGNLAVTKEYVAPLTQPVQRELHAELIYAASQYGVTEVYAQTSHGIRERRYRLFGLRSICTFDDPAIKDSLDYRADKKSVIMRADISAVIRSLGRLVNLQGRPAPREKYG